MEPSTQYSSDNQDKDSTAALQVRDKIVGTSRQQRRIAAKANALHDKLILSLLKVIQKENMTDGPEVERIFKECDRIWRLFARDNLKDHADYFSKNAYDTIKQIERVATEQDAQREAASRPPQIITEGEDVQGGEEAQVEDH